MTYDEGRHLRDEEQALESTAEQDRRLTASRARCARVRENTEHELARLAQQRAETRAQIGITSAIMEQWKLEHHQQMLRDSQP
ncbi:hypothetical protein GN244_ATG05299 [Phytophthora infestans]|uniref:Uncharacterized protein n=1 Tax=Phytophthora infestans TaxID=4787 RepID=A0A833SKH5_PHYIN|nr:hypothetical protein GN244_ATG05299 [Phytophthora infestans]KAF4144111.1 hypothetical protein GN958_ATG06703 [Phytophthora infestans]